MPTEILHYEGKFVLWSSVVEAPASDVLNEDDLRELLYHEAQIGDWQTYQLDWHPLAIRDIEADEAGEVAKIERRIARTKLNNASGLRWYGEPYYGEMWLQQGIFTLQEIFEYLAADREPEYRLDDEENEDA